MKKKINKSVERGDTTMTIINNEKEMNRTMENIDETVDRICWRADNIADRLTALQLEMYENNTQLMKYIIIGTSVVVGLMVITASIALAI